MLTISIQMNIERLRCHIVYNRLAYISTLVSVYQLVRIRRYYNNMPTYSSMKK